VDTFLDESQTFMRAITESFHLINTSRAGLELLTGQVDRVVKAGADDRVIEALFPMPDGTTGQNLRAHTLRAQSAKDRELAEMWLFAVVARYETWGELIESEHGLVGATRASQFADAQGNAPGYGEIFGTLGTDPDMAGMYSQAVGANNLFLSTTSIAKSALQVFRYYKEVRNSLAHSDARANQRLATASGTAQSALNSLKLTSSFRSNPVPVLAVGDPVLVDFAVVRDVVALLRRLVFTIDARVLLSPVGRVEFENRWKAVHGQQPVKVSFNKLKRSAWYSAFISHALAMPSPPAIGQKPGAVWPQTAREAFVDFAVPGWLIRRI
jgi:hypothetical protein